MEGKRTVPPPTTEVTDVGAFPLTAAPEPNPEQPRPDAYRARRSRRQRPHADFPAQRHDPTSQFSSRPPRIALEQQVSSQAPPEAAGYRLVLPTRSHAETPKIAPAFDVAFGLAYWTLNPFQLPDDVRLQDGHTYRILWVNAQGQPVPPHGAAYLPAVHFFLGPPDPEPPQGDATTAQSSSILRDITSPEVRAQAEAECVKLRIAEARAQQRERLLQHQIAAAEAQLRIDREVAERRQRERAAEVQAAKVQQEEAEQRSAKQREEHARLMKEYERAELRNGLIALGAQLGTLPIGLLLATLIRHLKGERVSWAELRASALAALMSWSAASETPVRDKQSPVDTPAVGTRSLVDAGETSPPPSVSPVEQDPSPSQPTAAEPTMAVGSEITREAPSPSAPHAEQTAPPPSSQPQHADAEVNAAVDPQPADPRTAETLPGPTGLSPIEEEELRIALSHPGLRDALLSRLVSKSSSDVRMRVSVAEAERDLDESQQALVARAASNTTAMRWYVQTMQDQTGEPELFHGFDAEPASSPEFPEMSSEPAASKAPALSQPPQPEASPPITPAPGANQLRFLVAIVTDPEKMAQFLYEKRRLAAQADGQAAPQEPQTDLSGDQRKEIRLLAQDPGLCSELFTLNQKFEDACRRGPEALFHLRAPFSSLRDGDRTWIRDGVATEERRVYLQYLRSRQAALLDGSSLPPHPPTRLSPKEQKLVRRVARDRRAMAVVAQRSSHDALSEDKLAGTGQVITEDARM